MDIGVPLRDLGAVEVGPLRRFLEAASDDLWTRNTFRQDALADGAHASSQAIILRHEWDRSYNTANLQYLEDLMYAWAVQKNLDPEDYAPMGYRDTAIGPVYTFPDWRDFREVVAPVVAETIGRLKVARGVVTRLALVRLMPGGRIAPHVDGQRMAGKAHRIHVSITAPPRVEYKIGGRKFRMKAGHAYDFNNCMRHSVRHSGRLPRINLFLDYYPNPAPFIAAPLSDLGPIYTRRAPRLDDDPWRVKVA